MLEKKVINDFGKEWNTYNQTDLNKIEQKIIFDKYFSIFPKYIFNNNSIGADFGCGTGRWTEVLQNKIKLIYCVEPSDAINVAKKKLSNSKNIIFLNESIQNCSIKDSSLDFAFSLGVLHHVENINLCLEKIHKKLKINSPFLIYVYYNFENKNIIYKFIWKISNLFRIIISNLPFRLKIIVSWLISLFVYLPLAKISKFFSFLKINTKNIPLNDYKDKSFYTMKTDALDRFGTKLEKRFSKKDIYELLINNGFKDITFSDKSPYWCVCCYKK